MLHYAIVINSLGVMTLEQCSATFLPSRHT